MHQARKAAEAAPALTALLPSDEELQQLAGFRLEGISQVGGCRSEATDCCCVERCSAGRGLAGIRLPEGVGHAGTACCRALQAVTTGRLLGGGPPTPAAPAPAGRPAPRAAHPRSRPAPARQAVYVDAAGRQQAVPPQDLDSCFLDPLALQQHDLVGLAAAPAGCRAGCSRVGRRAHT